MRFKKKLILIFLSLGWILLQSNNVNSINNRIEKFRGESHDLSVQLLFTLGTTDRESESFYNPGDVAIGENGNIYVLDSGNSRIQCFSSKGEFLFSFGRYGQGPGELSKNAATLEVLSDGNLYLIDNQQYRISVFSPKGDFIKSYKIRSWYDDIFLFKDKYYLTSFEISENHRPIHIASNLNKIEKSFGSVVDPGFNLFEMVKLSPIPQEKIFSNQKMSSLIVNSKGHIYYSQRNPYKIIKYLQNGVKMKEFSRKVKFETRYQLSMEYKEGVLKKTLPGPSATIPEIYFWKNEFILVPIFSPDRAEKFLDIYDPDGNLAYSYKFPIELYEKEKGIYIAATELDRNNNFYCLYYTQKDPPLLSIYAITIK